MRWLLYCAAVWSLMLMISGPASACGTRRVLYIDVSGTHRIVEEPITLNGEILRACGGGKIVYTDPASGRKFVVDRIVDQTKAR